MSNTLYLCTGNSLELIQFILGRWVRVCEGVLWRFDWTWLILKLEPFFFFNVYLILFIHLAGSNSQCYVARACSVALHYFSEEIKQTRPFFKQMLLRGSDMKHERTCMTKVKVSITSGIHLLNNQTLLKALYSTIALFEQYFKV